MTLTLANSDLNQNGNDNIFLALFILGYLNVITVGRKTKGATGEQLFLLKTWHDEYRRT